MSDRTSATSELLHRALRGYDGDPELTTEDGFVRWGVVERRLNAIVDAAVAEALEAFSRTNRERCESPSGFNHKLDSWSLSDWFTAALGELGEAANVAKKLNRVRDGIPGNKETADELRAKLKAEVADTIIYLDLLAQSQGFLLTDAVRETFNRKSEQLGCPIRYEPIRAVEAPPSAAEAQPVPHVKGEAD